MKFVLSILGSSVRIVIPLLAAVAVSGQTPVPDPKESATKSNWRDPSDGWLDLSELLAKPGRFVPMVMPITEPAVGFGVAGGPIFLRPRTSEGSQGWTRPNITTAGGMYTSNGSWALMAVDSSSWRKDRIETVYGGGHASINLKYFGEEDTGNSDASTLGLNITMSGAMAKGKLRFGNSRFYGGLRYLYMQVEATPTRTGSEVTPPEGLGRNDRLAGPALSLVYDTRNTILTPSKGLFFESTYSYFDPSFGGSINYQRFDQVAIGYIPLASRWTLGIRGDGEFTFGNPVFYARPYVTLRGVPAMRYQRQHLAQGEAELRWQFWKRLSILGFGGAGTVWNTTGAFKRRVDVSAAGTGFRYELARKFGLHYGVDVARGPEDWAIYFQFGSAWMRP